MTRATEGRAFIAWAPYSRRSQALADELGMKLHLVHYLGFQRPIYAPAKYVLQALRTLWLLLEERPHIVFVQDPPIFASAIVYSYAVLTNRQARYIVDAHTGALLHPWWRPFRALQKFLYRRALTVITTNRTLTNMVQSWGADSTALAGPPVHIPPGDPASLNGSFNLVLVNTFSQDEPVAAVLQAAAGTPDVRVYITGDVGKAPLSLLKGTPDNVTFTGFLPDAEYARLLRGADAIMALTSKDHTLQLGCMEAVAVGKPIITSDWPFLREVFGQGTIHVPNTPEGIRTGIIEMQEDASRLTAEIHRLREMHQARWIAQSRQLRELIATRERQ